jgi:ribonuclease P protein component
MTSFDFSRNARLLRPAEFKRVFENTELRGSTSCLLVLASANQQTRARLGFVIAKKQVRHAVDRNRVKRLVRESFRLNNSRLESLDFVILARSGVIDMDNQQLREMIDALWFRLKRPNHVKPDNRQRKKRR